MDDEDHLADDFVTLAGWGLDDNFDVTNTLAIESLSVYPKELCEEIFSQENVVK